MTTLSLQQICQLREQIQEGIDSGLQPIDDLEQYFANIMQSSRE